VVIALETSLNLTVTTRHRLDNTGQQPKGQLAGDVFDRANASTHTSHKTHYMLASSDRSLRHKAATTSRILPSRRQTPTILL